MKNNTILLLGILILFSAFQALGQFPVASQKKKSLLDNDPDVIYIKEHLKRSIHLYIHKPAVAYATKNIKRRLGEYAPGTKVELVAMTDKAYRVKGKARHAGVTGWVDPRLLASKDKNFVENLKKLYERQMVVKELIARNDVAIGMTIEEVFLSMGKPTETQIKQTRKGETGKWDYVISEEQKYYRSVRDPYTGQVYQQLSHISTVEKERTTLEFENGLVSSVIRKTNENHGRVRIIPAPIIFHW